MSASSYFYSLEDDEMVSSYRCPGYDPLAPNRWINGQGYFFRQKGFDRLRLCKPGDKVINYLFVHIDAGLFSWFLRLLDWLTIVHVNQATDRFRVFACLFDNRVSGKPSVFQVDNLPPNTPDKINYWDELFEPLSFYSDLVDAKRSDARHHVYHIRKFSNVLPPHFQLRPHLDTVMPEFRNYFCCTPVLYKHTQFSRFRQHFYPILQTYIRPKPGVVNKVERFLVENGKTEEQRWLGIHVRVPVHHYITSHSNADVMQYYTSILENIRPITAQENPSVIFVATESQEFLDLMQKEYGSSRIRSLAIPRVVGNIDWDDYKHKSQTISFGQELENALLDMLLLSKCDFLLGGVSNMFLTALLFNPTVRFQLIPFLENHQGH